MRDIISFSILTILSNCILASGLVSSCCKLLLSAIIIIISMKIPYHKLRKFYTKKLRTLYATTISLMINAVLH